MKGIFIVLAILLAVQIVPGYAALTGGVSLQKAHIASIDRAIAHDVNGQ